eukprot:scaffold2908_cov105-Isochrysis_galbana.AAC.6
MARPIPIGIMPVLCIIGGPAQAEKPTVQAWTRHSTKKYEAGSGRLRGAARQSLLPNTVLVVRDHSAPRAWLCG